MKCQKRKALNDLLRHLSQRLALDSSVWGGAGKCPSIASCLALMILATQTIGNEVSTEQFSPPSKALEGLVVSTFSSLHDGWSVDEVLLDDKRRTEFESACMAKQSELEHELNEDAACRALLHVRKRGGHLPKATRRDSTNRTRLEVLLPVAEIAARRLSDELGVHTDAILVSRTAREMFDQQAQEILPDCSSYLVRKAALQLRKTRKLEPELLSRVTNWHRRIEEHDATKLAQKTSDVSTRPGIYIFRDVTGFLYIGQARNLRKRLSQHLRDSDRRTLAAYLASRSESVVKVELHIFDADSPGEDLRVRRAYESELIRTRKPRLNVAP